MSVYFRDAHRLAYSSKAKGGMLDACLLLNGESMSYFDAPIWDKKKCPHLDPFAVPLNDDVVHGRRVIHVKNAMYRNAVFDGTFLLSKTVVLPLLPKVLPKMRVKVECCWYGHRLKKGEPRFLVDVTTAVVDESYDGTVTKDLGKRPL